MAMPTPADLQQGVPATANIVKRIPGPSGGELLLDANGGVYAIGGAQYQGSYLDDAYVAPEHRNDPNRQFSDIRLNPEGGYALASSRGEEYNLAPAWQQRQQQAVQQAATPAANSLYSDPAFLAFIRQSDLGIETVAEQVRRKNAALQSALGLDIARTQNAGQQSREGINNSYEARGVFRSGKRLQDLARQENDQSDVIAQRRASTTEQIAAGHDTLANAVADRMRQAGEQGFSTSQTQDLENRNEELRKKYPNEYGTGA